MWSFLLVLVFQKYLYGLDTSASKETNAKYK